MLNKATAQLVEEVMAHFGEKQRRKAKENPEVCLVSMLMRIKEKLPHVWATLGITIRMTTSDERLEKAREVLKQAEKEEVKS